MGRHLETSDTLPIQPSEDSIGVVHNFTYLGSNISEDGEMRLAQVLAKQPGGQSFRIVTCWWKQSERYTKPNVLLVILYGGYQSAELETHNNGCIEMILGVSTYQQWRQHITSKQLAEAFGMEDTMKKVLLKRRLR